jgi:DNA polymerase I-like protein with 3'-5' exonuclease and polymerase domains
LAATRDLVTDTMEHAHELTFRLKVDVSVGKNWMEMK